MPGGWAPRQRCTQAWRGCLPGASDSVALSHQVGARLEQMGKATSGRPALVPSLSWAHGRPAPGEGSPPQVLRVRSVMDTWSWLSSPSEQRNKLPGLLLKLDGTLRAQALESGTDRRQARNHPPPSAEGC